MKKPQTLIFLFFTFFLFNLKLFAQCDRASDSLELVKIYNNFDGENWTYPDSFYNFYSNDSLLVPNFGNAWDFNRPIDQWYGVELNAGGCVETLVLHKCNLTGTLFDIQLPEVFVLKLDRNEISGDLIDFSGIPNVRKFALFSNDITGSIPDFSNLPLVYYFSLSTNDLTGNIPNFSKLENLDVFSCSSNELTGEIPNFSNTPGLRYIYCSGNELSGEIPDFDNLPRLWTFFCSNNNLTGEIPKLWNTRLTNFTCSYNNLTGEIPFLDSLPNLYTWNCSYNSITGEIPNLDRLTNLNYFTCDSNFLTGNIPTLDSLSELESFSCSQNSLSGEIPDLNNNPELAYFSCSDNRLTGEIPSLGNNQKLESFYCRNNELEGNIPDINNLPELDRFYCNNNNLTGCFPNGTCDINIFDARNNIALPWGGDRTEFCNGESQYGAPCDDGDLDTSNDVIGSDCGCRGCPSKDIIQEICPEDNLIVNNNIYDFDNPSGQEIFSSSSVCDSIINVDLSFYPKQSLTQKDSFCSGQTYILANGNEVELPGKYDVTLVDANIYGCDSLITYELEVLQNSSSQDSITLCSGSSYQLPDGQFVSSVGTYVTEIAASNSCDSVVTTYLNFYPRITVIVQDSYCQGGTYTLPDNSQVDVPGQYRTILPNASQNGCDSTINTYLSQNPAYNTTEPVIICEGSSYILPDGNTATTEGDYISNLTTIAGCDSVVTTSLSYYPSASRSFSATYCQGSSFTLPDNSQVSAPGQYTVRLANIAPNGCDSILTVNLSELTTYNFTNSASICNGETYQLPDGRSVNTSNTYTSTLQTAAGCDSTIMTALTVFPPITPVTETAVICEGATYNWNGQTYQDEGNYAVTLQNNSGCDSTIQLALSVEGITTLGAADAGSDVSVCEDMVDLFANDLPNTTGNWISPNGVEVQPRNQGGAIGSELEAGLNTFIWTLSGGTCADYDSDTVLVNYITDSPRLTADFLRPDSANTQIIDVLGNDNLGGQSDFSVEVINSSADIANWQFNYLTNQLEVEITTRGVVRLDYEVCFGSCTDLCDTATVEMIVGGYNDEGEVNIIITPGNNDNKNDKLIFDDLDQYPNHTLYIYNRWGSMIYSASPYKNDWDGRRKNSRKRLPEGTYYYVMRKHLPDKIKYGSVTIKY